MGQMAEQSDFDGWFKRATGLPRPYAYQRALAERDRPPSVLAVPTGSGKTQAVIGAWLFQRLLGTAPRRLVYALPMRTLVEQTATTAHDMLERLKLSDQIAVHVLMGGQERPEADWRIYPEADQILIGTIDMLVSRALNRGYAEGRFVWPIAFGLLNADCRWVFDEVQLMGPARATSAQLDGLRAALGTALRCETMWLSATVDREALQTVDRPDLGEEMHLGDEDRLGGLKARLNATKVAERINLTDAPGADAPKLVAEVCAMRHIPGTRTIAVLNTVKDAQETFNTLQQEEFADAEPRLVLLHSRFRPPDRERHMRTALERPPAAGTIVVSTQVIEAGVDVSCATLITALAPFSSIVQRLGRCNRAGEEPRASVLWIDRGEMDDSAASKKLAAPYQPADLNHSRAKLIEMDGQSLSPAVLEGIEVDETREAPAILRRRDLLDLFDTAPDLSGTDIDIAPFIRPDDERTVFAFFRDRSGGPPTEDDPLPAAKEIVQVPRTDLTKRARWISDHVNGAWLRVSANQLPPPGAAVMLDAAEGGYDPALGWSTTKRPVEATLPDEPEPVEGFASDRHGRHPEELSDHLEAVTREATALADALDLSEWKGELAAAAALHDIGKAHKTFQALMRTVLGVRPEDSRLWAKSGKRGGPGYDRRFFRHELPSALAVTRLGDKITVPRPQLTRYLVAAHHGRVRVSIRPAPGESAPAGIPDGAKFALGIVDGDELPPIDTPLGRTPTVTLNLDSMELGAEDSWVDHAIALRDDPALGPFRLGLLEAILRMADWRASGA